MQNVEYIDKKVNRMRDLVSRHVNKKFAPVSIEDLLDYLECLERLSAVERHLYNLVSMAYVEKESVNAQ